MLDRRKFLANTTLASTGLFFGRSPVMSANLFPTPGAVSPVAISTWEFGLKANARAWEILDNGGAALDAVEAGINLIEADPDNLSVGIGGLPDRDGIVSLDACIMDEKGRAGSVTFLQDIVHPISVARLVMEKTPHVMLSGEGALRFALDSGFERKDLMTDKAREAWEKWKVSSKYKPVINIENHDTIGLLVMDKSGNLCGGCSTSGLAYKMHGRVGDSPIIGAGLYVDNEVGAAVATGLGELMMRTLSSFLVVELMRSGANPAEACQEAIRRIVRKFPDYDEAQAAIIAVSMEGETGAFAIQKGFNYAVTVNGQHKLIEADTYI